MISNNISVNSEKKPASKLKIQEISLIIQKTIDKAIICKEIPRFRLISSQVINTTREKSSRNAQTPRK